MQEGSQAIRYGQPERWKLTSSRVRSIFEQPNPSEPRKLLQISAPVSDRRPPDTSDALGKANTRRRGRPPMKKTLVNALGGKANGKRPSQQQTSEAAMLIGEEKGSNSSKAIIELPENYQSYPHHRLSCYITAPLEVLYTCYLKDQEFWAVNVSSLSTEFGLKTLYDSFVMRDQASGSAREVTKATSAVSLTSEAFYLRTEIIIKQNIFVISLGTRARQDGGHREKLGGR